MNSGKRFNCAVIGSGSLPIRCAEILRLEGHEIVAVISADKKIVEWTREQGLVLLDPAEALTESLGEFRFDYLFSINNKYILRRTILDLPEKMGINYHDSPLPAYAGTHATSWAIINSEREHGISWHVLADTVDAGEILKQRKVEVARDETALTLNSKCYEAAIDSFRELVSELSAGTYKGVKQDLDQRSFFGRFKRPASAGLISWNRPSEEISALVRALDFGNHPNPLGAAKMAVGDSFVIVGKIDVDGTVSSEPPGTISEIGPELIKVSAVDREVVLSGFRLVKGDGLSASELADQFQLKEGDQLEDIDPDKARRLTSLNSKLCKREAHWVRTLSAFKPAACPYVKESAAHRQNGIESHAGARDTYEMAAEFGGETAPEYGLIACLAVLLSRLNGIDQVQIGYSDPQIRGTYAGFEDLISTRLPLSIDIDGSQDLRSVAREVRESIGILRKKGSYLFDILTRYPDLENVNDTARSMSPPVSVALVEDPADFTLAENSDLALVISERSPDCLWVFDAGRISAKEVSSLERHLRVLISGAVSDPDRPVSKLPLLTDRERRILLSEWNDTDSEHPDDLCLDQLFEAQASNTPDDVAVLSEEEGLTYKELNDSASDLALRLRRMGVGRESRVGICVRRSTDMAVGIFGILKAGGAYVPLDPAYPRERLEYILRDSRSEVLVTESSVDMAGTSELAKIYLDRPSRGPAESGGPVADASPRSSSDLAYVIYTSGSTGEPKGVAIEHRSAVALCSWAHTVFGPEELSGVLGSTSICFDLSVFEIFVPLTCGGKVVIAENLLQLPTLRHAEDVSLINTVPSILSEYLRGQRLPESVVTVNLAGEPLTNALVDKIYDLGTVGKVYDLYGPSEDTTYSTFALRKRGYCTIGKPISNTRAYVVDKELQLLPPGIPGELCLGGEGLARGYLDREELTKEKFPANPFSDDPGSRIYRTGDLARHLPDGDLEYLGRIDNQVKVRGIRIELGEIEAAIMTYDGVRSAAVSTFTHDKAGKSLVGYVVFEKSGNDLINGLKGHLGAILPRYMVPSVMMEMDALPLTPNGKVDRAALPKPRVGLSNKERSLEKARDQVEKRLVEIWQKVLKIDPIGITDNFFELGGDSLQAIHMFVEVEQEFGKNVPLTTLFEADTIEKLADILRKDEWEAPESSLVPIQPEGDRPIFFCFHARGGNVLFYRDLSKHLGSEQPFYGIQARRLGGRQVGHPSVEEMVEFYIEEIKKVQPEGPYYLGGSSFGGLAAYEAAQQFRMQGQEIALLALIDTGTPDYPKSLPATSRAGAKVYQTVRRIQIHADTLRLLGRKERSKYLIGGLKKTMLRLRRKVNNTYKAAARKYYSQKGKKKQIPKRYIQIEDQIGRAGEVYVPKAYPGKVMLFRATKQPLGIEPDPKLGWGNLAKGEVEIHDVPGHHGSIVAEPFVRVLAEKLDRCIEREWVLYSERVKK